MSYKDKYTLDDFCGAYKYMVNVEKAIQESQAFDLGTKRTIFEIIHEQIKPFRSDSDKLMDDWYQELKSWEDKVTS